MGTLAVSFSKKSIITVVLGILASISFTEIKEGMVKTSELVEKSNTD